MSTLIMIKKIFKTGFQDDVTNMINMHASHYNECFNDILSNKFLFDAIIEVSKPLKVVQV